MKKFLCVLAALVIFDGVLFAVNKYHDLQAKRPAVHAVSQTVASAPVRGEQKTYRVSFGIDPTVNSTVKQNQ